MRDLNELWHYAAVVQHGGFSAATRATGIAKSRLSKSVARLEERLALRLIERSTRRLRVTELGQEFFRHCQAMLESAEQAPGVPEPPPGRAARRPGRAAGTVDDGEPVRALIDWLADDLGKVLRPAR